ncbi:MAG: carbon-phosphorus lyase complex subunit PhnI [Nevskiaceae bacterium]|jgi:alpha-D-ribose 1-methylphosphonate 5-triphosphate synthase subunit PhnI|nr:carbon-phosphorus lyase complex subunit PhnI [Nevskiaceae bacterium]
MGYVAIKGGGNAIAGAAAATEFLRTNQSLHDAAAQPLAINAVGHQLCRLVDRIVSEGGVYHPTYAALAIKQSLGDALEAAFALRAWRSTMPRLTATPVLDTSRMRLIRRISSAFKDIPGGQMLGSTPDYALRMLRMELLDESPEIFRAFARDWLKGFADDVDADLPDSFPKVMDALRAEGLLPPVDKDRIREAFDITREPLVFPVPRSAALATMARAETGSLLAMAYTNMRGYGDIHPTVAELRVGYLPLLLPHPVTGELAEIGEALITECEVLAMYGADDNGGIPTFGIGYGACFGHNEVKAISMAILDRALQKGMKDGPSNPSEDPEFVLLHVDGIESMGFASHYKMPHYVTFQSDLDRLRTTQSKAGASQ